MARGAVTNGRGRAKRRPGPLLSLSAVRRDSAAGRAPGLQEARTFTSGLRHLLVVLCVSLQLSSPDD